MNEKSVIDWIKCGITPEELEWCSNNRHLIYLKKKHGITQYELDYLKERWGIR